MISRLHLSSRSTSSRNTAGPGDTGGEGGNRPSDQSDTQSRAVDRSSDLQTYNQQVATNRQLGNLFQQYRRILLVIRQKIQITENRSNVAIAIANYLRSVLPSNTHNITNIVRIYC